MIFTGYRSDVRLVISKRGYKELNKFINNYLKSYNINGKSFQNPLSETDIKYKSKDIYYLGWDEIKWYEYCSYKNIDAVMEGFKLLKNKDLSFYFSRMGENFGDYEEDYSIGIHDVYLPSPYVERSFDDKYMKDKFKEFDREQLEK